MILDSLFDRVTYFRLSLRRKPEETYAIRGLLQSDGSVRGAGELLSIARASLTDVARLVSRDAGVAAGLANCANPATRLGGRRRDVRSADTEGVEQPALRVGLRE